MRTGQRTPFTGVTARAAAPALALALAAVLAGAVVGLATLAVCGAPHPLRGLRLAASHRGPALDGGYALRVYGEVDRRARALPPEERARVARTILEEATRAELAPALVLAVIHVESGFRHRAASPAGALGLMQLMPATMHAELSRARVRGADPLDPVANVRAGVRYLGRLVRAFDDVELALVAYNAGPARLRRHLEGGQVPERLLRYAHLVRRHARDHDAAARGAPPPAPRLAVAPAHGSQGPRASWAGAVAWAPRASATAGWPPGWVTASAAATSAGPDRDAIPPLRRGRRDADPPREALARRPLRSRRHA